MPDSQKPRDDERNTEKKVVPQRDVETLKFHFTPVDPVNPAKDENPHAKATTHVPEVADALREHFGDEVVQHVEVYAGEYTVFVDTARIREVCQFLKDELGFTYLVDLGGIDRFTDEDRYEVFYNLVNITDRKRLRLKVRVDESTMTLPSIMSVYMAANWNERECYDMFGLRFDGHVDMRRMFMPEDFEYFPLRKEFPLLGVPGSLPLPPQVPEGDLTLDPFAAAHGKKPIKSYEEPKSPEFE